MEFHLGTKVLKVSSDGKSCAVEVEGRDPFQCDRVLIAVGRRPCTDNLGLDVAGVVCDKRGFIQINSSYQTTTAGVYAIGDVVGGAMLAHKAEE